MKPNEGLEGSRSTGPNEATPHELSSPARASGVSENHRRHADSVSSGVVVGTSVREMTSKELPVAEDLTTPRANLVPPASTAAMCTNGPRPAILPRLIDVFETEQRIQN